MFASDPCFVAWEERILCHDRGSRVVHFYLKEESGDTILAVIGAERSIRHMLYAVSDEFLHVYGTNTTCKKWRARREVVDWLTLLVSKHRRVSSGLDLNLAGQGTVEWWREEDADTRREVVFSDA